MGSQLYNLKDFKEAFDKAIKTHRGRILVTSHMGPDDDAISSVLAIQEYLLSNLKINKKRVEAVFSSPPEDRWEYFKGFEKIKFVEDIAGIVKKKDLIILLDAKDWNRITKSPEKIETEGIKSICIDHHKSNLREGTTHSLMLTHPEVFYGSNAEILYWMLFHTNRKTLSKELCEILLLGIYGDSGSFTFIGGKDETSAFIAAKNLIDAGDIKIDTLKQQYLKLNLGGVKVLALLLNNMQQKKIGGWPKFVYSFVDREDMGNFTEQEFNEGWGLFKEYIKSIKGTEWGFSVKYSAFTNSWSISFRSVPGSVNVRLIAEEFNGGGHDLAAGGKLEFVEREKAKYYVDQVIKYIRNNKPTLT